MQQVNRIESWRPVVGWEGWYEVSDLGRVRSVDRVVQAKNGQVRFRRGQIRALAVGRDATLLLTLYRPGFQRTRPVHVLVLEAFAGPCPPGQECRHGPGGPTDNRWPEAIRWGTKEDNNGADKRRDGTLRMGEQHHNAKLTETIVRDCRAWHAAGRTYEVLAQEFGVCTATMREAIVGVTWKHVL